MARSNDGLTKLRPGKWRARITQREPGTNRKLLDTTRTIEADTRGEARVKREALRTDLLGQSGEWTVSEAIDEWLPTMPTNTRRVRVGHAARFRERFGALRLSRVPPNEVQAWLSTLTGRDSTANVHRSSIKALYEYARSQGKLVGANPMLETTKRRTPQSSAQLLAALEKPAERRALLGSEVPRFFAALEIRDAALLPLARMQLLLGCRFAEAAALQWHDVDWETGVVTIRRSQLPRGELGPPKGKKARIAALGGEGLAFLRGHRAVMEREQLPGWGLWMFPKPVYPDVKRAYDMWNDSTVRRRIHDVLDTIGVSLESVTHAFRHTHVTIARSLEQDAVMRESVGHADERQTERYTDDSHRAVVAQQFAADLETKLAGVVPGVAVPITTAKPKRK